MRVTITNTQVLCIIFACVIMITTTALPLLEEDRDLEKKSNLNEFMSAMKGAGRLRYGKRSLRYAVDEDTPTYYVPQRPVYKRMAQNLPELIDTLNGAERLRFGRK
ncbi:unnamed protein product [Bursaphelenchus okinawaensis]|uniref:Uncharacterized protein n=1 Tax=Bursaphelenchus okinawaensis TaxID=465554 RepID=A0A811L8F3_9BILA|nr:unnamed protein product [Bursaphelenchus okinawaensis]CAG9117822.1 unnamed protein product [Bursaphelenchus okinawaensis]